VTIGGVEYLALARPMQSDSASHVPQDPPAMLVVLRARAEQLRFLNTLQAGLAGALLVAVVLADDRELCRRQDDHRPLGRRDRRDGRRRGHRRPEPARAGAQPRLGR
jgi:hypothetical protein